MARTRTRWVLLAVLASVVCGWWATGLEPFSTRATLVVLAAGLVAMAAGGPRRAGSVTGGVTLRTAAPWAVLAGALVVWQLAAHVQHPRSDHPTLSSLINPALDPRPVRALAFAGWALTAGWLARR